MSKVIAVDVDLVLARPDKSWYKFLCSVTGVSLNRDPWDSGDCEYDLTKYFKDELAREGLTGKEYWNIPNIYNDMEVTEGSREGCLSLFSMGYTLVPVSKVYYGHCQSKYDFLLRHFPMMESPIFLGMDGLKSNIKCDYIIEDRLSELTGFTLPTKGIILDTPYTQECVRLDIPHIRLRNWSEVVDELKQEAKYE